MIKYIVLFLIFHSSFANLDKIKNDNFSLVEHVGDVISVLSKEITPNSCPAILEAQIKCSPVILNHMKDREEQGFFKFFVNETPRDLCSGISLNDHYYTSAKKLDNYFQSYTQGLVPSFSSINQSCFQELSSLKEQNSAVSYYYYAQMRLLEDGVKTLNSSAAIDKKLGRSILSDFKCSELGRLKDLCFELKSCKKSSKNFSNDIAETRMAIDLKKNIEDSRPRTNEEKIEKDRVLGGIERLYPWIEGKEFKKTFNKNKVGDDSHVEFAITKQLEQTRIKLKERIAKYDGLSKCIENESSDCDSFHEKLNELSIVTSMDSSMNERDLYGSHYQKQQSCINNQIIIRDSANESINEFIIGSGLTIATMGLSSIAVGSGHIIKAVQTSGALSRTQKLHRSISTLSLQNSNKIKLSAKYLILSLNGAFTARGVKDAAKACEKDLSHLVEFKKLTGPSQNSSICPKDNQNPEFELMSDIKSCAINAALSSLDFLPIIPYGIAKYKRTRPNKENDSLLFESNEMTGIGEVKLKKMDPKYLNEENGLSKGISTTLENGRLRKTKYLKSKKMRAKFRAHIRDGKLYNSQGKAFNSIEDIPSIYVIDKKGNLYFHAEPDGGRFHHSTFLGGEDVLSAGNIRVTNGKITMIDNESGHYKPYKINAYKGLYHLLKSGADFSKVEPRFIEYPNIDNLFNK